MLPVVFSPLFPIYLIERRLIAAGRAAGKEAVHDQTHTHKQAVLAAVKDGTNAVFTSTDWEHPGASTFTAPSFSSFSTNELTYECTYDNPTNSTITTGDSRSTDEVCMAVGYFFPATKSLFCFNDFLAL